MPHIKQPKVKEPLWKDWDYLAQKKGVRHTVYSVNGDQYTGEWLDNKKDGKCNFRFIYFFTQSHHFLSGFCSLKYGTHLMMRLSLYLEFSRRSFCTNVGQPHRLLFYSISLLKFIF